MKNLQDDNNQSISISNTLNINGLNLPVKTHRFLE